MADLSSNYTPAPNPILDSNSPVWLMVPDEKKQENKPIVAGCSCSDVCNALNDFDESDPS
jgi:hypothetical protein